MRKRQPLPAPKRSTRDSRPNLRSALLAFAITAMLAVAGCATPGPLHVYALPETAAREIVDHGMERKTVPSFLEASDRVSGFAYDPFTDHFFLRLAAGNALRVVDRPARAIKREFTIEMIPSGGGGDLAVKPINGHLFLLHPTAPAVFEVTRLGKYLRTFRLADHTTAPAGIGYDARHDRLLVLGANRRTVTTHTLDGASVGPAFELEREVAGSLAFDGEARELYAPLAVGGEVGVFDESGRLRRTLREPASFVDVGPRSLVRVF